MSKNFKKISKKRTVDQTLVGAKILKVNRNKSTGRFVLVLDNNNIVHVGVDENSVKLSRKKY